MNREQLTGHAVHLDQKKLLFKGTKQLHIQIDTTVLESETCLCSSPSYLQKIESLVCCPLLEEEI